MKVWPLVIVGLLIFGALLYVAASSTPNHQVSYDTYVSIMLTALGVMLAALAISIGIAAIWGYQQIKTEASNAAEKAVSERVNKLLELQNIPSMINQAVQREGDRVYNDLVSTRSEAASENAPIADEYPNEEEGEP